MIIVKDPRADSDYCNTGILFGKNNLTFPQPQMTWALLSFAVICIVIWAILSSGSSFGSIVIWIVIWVYCYLYRHLGLLSSGSSSGSIVIWIVFGAIDLDRHLGLLLSGSSFGSIVNWIVIWVYWTSLGSIVIWIVIWGYCHLGGLSFVFIIWPYSILFILYSILCYLLYMVLACQAVVIKRCHLWLLTSGFVIWDCWHSVLSSELLTSGVVLWDCWHLVLSSIVVIWNWCCHLVFSSGTADI
jgi:hypothetical protein